MEVAFTQIREPLESKPWKKKLEHDVRLFKEPNSTFFN